MKRHPLERKSAARILMTRLQAERFDGRVELHLIAGRLDAVTLRLTVLEE